MASKQKAQTAVKVGEPKFYNADLGGRSFGFIKNPSGGKDIYFHCSALRPGLAENPRTGNVFFVGSADEVDPTDLIVDGAKFKLAFVEAAGPKGPVATHVAIAPPWFVDGDKPVSIGEIDNLLPGTATRGGILIDTKPRKRRAAAASRQPALALASV